jgi:tellurite resistance protein TerC
MTALFSGQTGAWLALIVALVALLAVDLMIVRGRKGEMTVKAASIWSAAWILISLAFAGVLAVAGSPGQAEGFLAGYLVEKSLSLDNVFVFLIVFQAFSVAESSRAKLLTYGIVGALVLRAVFIVAGATALEHASWLSIPFAALLAWTGWRLWRGRHEHGGEERLVERVKGRLRIAEGDHGAHLTVRENGRRALTLGGAALVAIAVVDIIFAVDSVPAILAITTDTYVVFAANAFALLGLRPLFFLVADLVERLYYLKAALAVLLMFIAAKMAAGEFVGKLGPEVSLAGVAVILGAGVVASLLRKDREESTV